MRKRPSTAEEAFINSAATTQIDEGEGLIDDLSHFVCHIKWPIDNNSVNVKMAEGSNLTKVLSLSIKEAEWNTIDRHTQSIGVKKIDWIRHAIFKQIQEEQLHCFKLVKKQDK